MTDSERRLLTALVYMVRQHLPEHGDEIDNLAESAGERAIQVLADFGLMELRNSRFGFWTEAGKNFIKEIYPHRRQLADGSSGIVLVGKKPT